MATPLLSTATTTRRATRCYNGSPISSSAKQLNRHSHLPHFSRCRLNSSCKIVSSRTPKLVKAPKILWRANSQKDSGHGEAEEALMDQMGQKIDADSPLTEGVIGTYVNRAIAIGDSLPPEGFILLMSCFVGLLTGVAVVIFNLGVHEIHDLAWHDIPSSGANWLRTQPLQQTWSQLVFVPAGGGVAVGILNSIRNSFELSSEDNTKMNSSVLWPKIKGFFRPILKALAAAVTLGTGNSLGPEGPSVEIGASIADGVGTILKNSKGRNLSLIAAGSAAGISSGFNAAVAGCFFAVESVLRPSSADSAPSLTTAMVILSSVLASVVSQAGLGSDPAFKIPAYDFRSPAELPLYLLLGILCGLVSVALTLGSGYSTSAFDALRKFTGIPTTLLPPLGGVCVGVIALAYPEVLYWGFENVDVLLESRPSLMATPTMLLFQLVGAKLVATCVCRGSGLVGGVYAPSLFIGAALGSAYGKLASYVVTHADPMYHLDALKVALPQAYALVGMAAMLAGVCQVPLTSVLLLFELTRDYRIILPLMGAVGLSSWVASAFQVNRATALHKTSQSILSVMPSKGIIDINTSQPQLSPMNVEPPVSENARSTRSESEDNYGIFNEWDICQLDNSLCIGNQHSNEDKLLEEILVATAMRSHFAAVSPDTPLYNALELMLLKKEWFVLLVNDNNVLQGILTLADIQQAAETIKNSVEVMAQPVSAVCCSWVTGRQGSSVVTLYPDMSLKAAQQLMAGKSLQQVPVIARDTYIHQRIKVAIGILDNDLIQLACRAEATRRLLKLSLTTQVDGK